MNFHEFSNIIKSVLKREFWTKNVGYRICTFIRYIWLDGILIFKKREKRNLFFRSILGKVFCKGKILELLWRLKNPNCKKETFFSYQLDLLASKKQCNLSFKTSQKNMFEVMSNFIHPSQARQTLPLWVKIFPWVVINLPWNVFGFMILFSFDSQMEN